jgi:hypothetical protein
LTINAESSYDTLRLHLAADFLLHLQQPGVCKEPCHKLPYRLPPLHTTY